MPDQPTVLTRYNATDQDPVDVPARSLKVATRVRIPLGLLPAVDPVWATAVGAASNFLVREFYGVAPFHPAHPSDTGVDGQALRRVADDRGRADHDVST